MAFVSDLRTLGTGPSYGKYLASGVCKAGTRQLLLDLSMLPSDKAGVVAAACAVRDQVVTPASIKFHIDGLEGSNAVVRVAMPAAPKSVSVGGTALNADAFDHTNGTLLVRFTNRAAGVDVEIAR